MKLISLGQDLAIRAQVDVLFEPLQVTLSCVRVGVFLLNQLFQHLSQQARDQSMALDSKHLDLEQDLFGN
jgi:hypothetical protein